MSYGVGTVTAIDEKGDKYGAVQPRLSPVTPDGDHHYRRRKKVGPVQ
jgi:hypothetical protein